MKTILILLFLVSCSQVPTKKGDDDVSLDAALNQAQMSYLKGCVDAKKELKIPEVFEGCRDKSLLYRQELEEIMGQGL
ncbi:hypothetical protein [Peredibacter starrii]|uniref:Lipoprotein n=1 Tax=Peredibacter starrii TaxID=28202 RepID=A0AAX4HP01_9BACT|nr:hypothetical protein [Peredibacter starrii]WPU64848.1 hypothetical protein SOO65_19320 [Peredibacter starrii]